MYRSGSGGGPPPFQESPLIRTLMAAGLLLAVSAPGAAPARADAFTPCADAAAFPELQGSLCAVVAAPLNHAVPDDDEPIELFVRKFPAEGERRGAVWLIAGGPGESGAAFYPFLDTLRRAFPGMDLIAPDHRGTGYSSKLCPDQEAPDSEDGIDLAGSEWGPCIGSLHQDVERAHAFTITNAAHDLSGLIAAHRGEGEVRVYAVSYGTQLVLRMMQAAPVRIDGLILDGLAPPETAPQWDLSHRTAVVDQVGRSLLTPEQTTAYERLLAGASDQPAWREAVPGGDLRLFMGALLNFPDLRARIPGILEALGDGDAAPLRRAAEDLAAVMESMNRFPQSPPSLPLVMLISGSENNDRRDLTAGTVASEAEGALFTSPLPGFLTANPLPLYDRDDAFGRTPSALPRTLVIHGAHDPNTPHDGAVAHVDLLRRAGPVELTTVEGAAHLLHFVAPECFVRSVRAFVEGAPALRACTPGHLSPLDM